MGWTCVCCSHFCLFCGPSTGCTPAGHSWLTGRPAVRSICLGTALCMCVREGASEGASEGACEGPCVRWALRACRSVSLTLFSMAFAAAGAHVDDSGRRGRRQERRAQERCGRHPCTRKPAAAGGWRGPRACVHREAARRILAMTRDTRQSKGVCMRSQRPSVPLTRTRTSCASRACAHSQEQEGMVGKRHKALEKRDACVGPVGHDADFAVEFCSEQCPR